MKLDIRIPLAGAAAVGPTQDQLDYYADEDVYYRIDQGSDVWTKWEGSIVTVGCAGSPAGGAPYDYDSIETAFNDTAPNDVIILAHYMSTPPVIVNPMYILNRTVIIKGIHK